MAQSHDRASQSFVGPSAIALQLEAPKAGHVLAPPLPHGEQGPDLLSDVLRIVKLSGALFFLADASFPWGVDVPRADAFAAILLPHAQHVVSYHVVLEGWGWASMPGVASVRFEAGDILVFPHGDPYSMLSMPDQAPEFDGEATVQFFREMVAGKLPFVVQEGGGGPERTQFVCGYLGCDVRPFNPVLSTLPRLLHVKRCPGAKESMLDGLIRFTLAEARNPPVGGGCIRLRLSELMFVEVVRQYLEMLPVHQTGWLAGLRDPAIGRVLSMLHERPAYPWTLSELAGRAGVSRPVLAARFAHLVGCPPMQYLTLWRMQIAARLLADGAMKVAAAANKVGYESEAAFSRAFKKAAGVPPAEWRSRHAPGVGRRSARWPERNGGPAL
jgi:AraC-like DNA-binding protein